MTALFAQLILPLNLSITLLVVALLVFMLRRRALAGLIALIALGWTLFWSIPAGSFWAGGMLEQRYSYTFGRDSPTAQVIVVLGGNTANARQNWFEPADSETAVLRTDMAARLYAAHKAPEVIVSGAALDGGISEARIMTHDLEKAGVPAAAIVPEERSYTTHENALYTAKMLKEAGIHRILLVTSALHMPRAIASFEKQGIHPIAAPTPPQIVLPDDPEFSVWTPNARALDASRSIIKEYLGLLVYWARGWI